MKMSAVARNDVRLDRRTRHARRMARRRKMLHEIRNRPLHIINLRENVTPEEVQRIRKQFTDAIREQGDKAYRMPIVEASKVESVSLDASAMRFNKTYTRCRTRHSVESLIVSDVEV